MFYTFILDLFINLLSLIIIYPMKNNLSHTLLLSISLVFISVLTRVLPHPSNVAPIAAVALFSGSIFANRFLALCIPMLSLILGDLILNYFMYGMGLNPFYSGFYVVYGCTALVVLLGMLMKRNIKSSAVFVYSICGSVVFFLITNFSVWLGSSMYPQTIQGLINCYTLAIPFFQNSVAGDLFFNCLFFGAYFLVGSRKAITA